MAARAGSTGVDDTPIPLSVARAAIHAKVRAECRHGCRYSSDGNERHWWRATGGADPVYPAHFTRAEERAIAQLRASEGRLTRQYRHACQFREKAGSAEGRPLTSPNCECGAVETVEHLVLMCPLTEAARRSLLTTPTAQRHGRSLLLLGKEPAAVMDFLQSVGRADFASRRARPAATAETPLSGAVSVDAP